MDFRGDDRGQAIQIGAVLLFGVLIIAFAGYQAFVVPNQNERVEFSHNQEVQQDLQNVRNAIVSGVGGGTARSVTVDLGVRYPARAVALNPGPATGTLRTNGTTSRAVNVSIRNANASGETGDFWDGDPRNYTTGALVYEPNYNRYRAAPTTIYDSTVLSNQFRDGNRTITGQRLLNGRTITLATLNGSVSTTTSEAISLDVRPVSSSSRTVQIQSTAADPLTVTVPTRLSSGTWTQLLRGEPATWEYDADGEPGGFSALTITLDPGWYTLRMAKIGVGTQVRDEDEAYVTTVGGQNLSVQSDETRTLVAEVRDAYNNPVAGELVNASADRGEITVNDDVTDSDGRVRFQYTAPSTVGEDRVTVDIADSPTAAEKATFTVSVTGGQLSEDSGFRIQWQDPAGNNDGAALSDCSAESCTWDVGASDDATLALRAETSPDDIRNVGVEFRGTDSSVAVVSPADGTTDSDGETVTQLDAQEDGTVRAYVLASGGSDSIDVEVTNVTTGDPLPSGSVAYDDENGNRQFDAGESDYTPNDLANGNVPGDADLVIARDTEPSGVDVSAGSITVQSGVTVGTQYGPVGLDASGGPVRIAGTIDNEQASGNGVTITGSTVDLTDGTVRTSGSLSVEGTASDVTFDSATLDTTPGSGQTVTITAGGALSGSSAAVTSSGSVTMTAEGSSVSLVGSTVDVTDGNNQDIGITSNGPMDLRSVRLVGDEFSEFSGERNGGSNTVTVSDAIFEEGDGTPKVFDLSPGNGNIVGTPEKGTVE